MGRVRTGWSHGLVLALLLVATPGWAGPAGESGPAGEAAPDEAAAARPEATAPFPRTETRAPCDAYDPLRRPFFGDLHVHTAFSFDASTQDTRNRPEDAYRFARGEPMGIQPYTADGKPTRTIQLEKPLDFVAVTDHSEMLGEIHICMTPGTPGYDSWVCKVHRRWGKLSFRLLAFRTLVLRGRWGFCGDGGVDCLAAATGVWDEIQQAAEDAYDRSPACQFTSFVAYEWTATLMDGINLHRNVIFRNERVPDLPISWVEAPSAAKLWDMLDEECVKGVPGCEAITIPHNANLSAGLMFESAKLESPRQAGMPIDAAEARRRAYWEPLQEVMQHKGSSECRLGVDTTDELCGFEPLPYDRFGPKFSILARNHAPVPQSYIRWALKQGLRHQAEQGANPFQFGLIASTDTHIAAPGQVSEKHHPGHGGAGVGARGGVPVGFPDDIEYNPGGLAVLWAEENSRDALFEAMRRREAYGTSGNRPVVRFFAGWDYPSDLCGAPDFAARGYAGGVPMGGVLEPPAKAVEPPSPLAGDGAAAGAVQLVSARGSSGAFAPHLAVFAQRDPSPDAGLLQRIQVVKGWLDGEGEAREAVLDVAGGPNEATVDLATCEPQGPGAASLCTVWTDPDFDPAAPAFYYARVVENPSCRWSQYVCNEARVDCSNPDSVPEALAPCCSDTQQKVIQERAWTSPIWYVP